MPRYVSKKGVIKKCSEYLLSEEDTFEDFFRSLGIVHIANTKSSFISSVEYYLEYGSLTEEERAILSKAKDKNETAIRKFNLYCKKIILDVIKFIGKGDSYNNGLSFELLDYYLIYGSAIALETLSRKSDELRSLKSEEDIEITLEGRNLFCRFANHTSTLYTMIDSDLSDISLKNNVKSCSINGEAVLIPEEIQDTACTLINKLKIPRTYRLYRQLCKRVMMFGEEYFDKYLNENEKAKEIAIGKKQTSEV